MMPLAPWGDSDPDGDSPVNTFRLILTRYFGAEMPILPDRTFGFESDVHPCLFAEVTERFRAPPETEGRA